MPARAGLEEGVSARAYPTGVVAGLGGVAQAQLSSGSFVSSPDVVSTHLNYWGCGSCRAQVDWFKSGVQIDFSKVFESIPLPIPTTPEDVVLAELEPYLAPSWRTSRRAHKHW